MLNESGRNGVTKICMGQRSRTGYLLIKRRVRVPARPACRGGPAFVPPEPLGGPGGRHKRRCRGCGARWMNSNRWPRSRSSAPRPSLAQTQCVAGIEMPGTINSHDGFVNGSEEVSVPRLLNRLRLMNPDNQRRIDDWEKHRRIPAV